MFVSPACGAPVLIIGSDAVMQSDKSIRKQTTEQRIRPTEFENADGKNSARLVAFRRYLMTCCLQRELALLCVRRCLLKLKRRDTANSRSAFSARRNGLFSACRSGIYKHVQLSGPAPGKPARRPASSAF